jgi:predicted enzyme related to lactoylglutathione lyase
MKKEIAGINFFELPVKDMPRAIAFYNAVLGTNIQTMDFQGYKMGFLTQDREVASGALVNGDGYRPVSDGSVIYFDCGEDLAPCLKKAESSGGKTVVPKTEIGGGMGFFAHFLDTEGTRVGFWSKS